MSKSLASLLFPAFTYTCMNVYYLILLISNAFCSLPDSIILCVLILYLIVVVTIQVQEMTKTLAQLSTSHFENMPM